MLPPDDTATKPSLYDDHRVNRYVDTICSDDPKVSIDAKWTAVGAYVDSAPMLAPGQSLPYSSYVFPDPGYPLEGLSKDAGSNIIRVLKDILFARREEVKLRATDLASMIDLLIEDCVLTEVRIEIRRRNLDMACITVIVTRLLLDQEYYGNEHCNDQPGLSFKGGLKLAVSLNKLARSLASCQKFFCHIFAKEIRYGDDHDQRAYVIAEHFCHAKAAADDMCLVLLSEGVVKLEDFPPKYFCLPGSEVTLAGSESFTGHCSLTAKQLSQIFGVDPNSQAAIQYNITRPDIGHYQNRARRLFNGLRWWVVKMLEGLLEWDTSFDANHYTRNIGPYLRQYSDGTGMQMVKNAAKLIDGIFTHEDVLFVGLHTLHHEMQQILSYLLQKARSEHWPYDERALANEIEVQIVKMECKYAYFPRSTA